MTDYLTDDQISYMVHGYAQRTISHSIFLIKLIMIDFLSERQQIAIRLRFYKGMTYKAIGDILGYRTGESGRRIVKDALKTIWYYYPKYKNKDEYQIVYSDGKISTKNFPM